MVQSWRKDGDTLVLVGRYASLRLIRLMIRRIKRIAIFGDLIVLLSIS